MANHHHDFFRRQRACCGHDMREEWLAGQRMEDLRQLRVHALALACRENDDV